MTRFFILAASALAVTSIGTTSLAQARCWTGGEVEAAYLWDMHSMLKSSEPTCRMQGASFTMIYNDFVRKSRSSLATASDRLKGHFAGSDIENGSDGYVKKLASQYRADKLVMDCSSFVDLVSATADQEGSIASLARIAKGFGSQPAFPDGICPTTIVRR